MKNYGLATLQHIGRPGPGFYIGEMSGGLLLLWQILYSKLCPVLKIGFWVSTDECRGSMELLLNIVYLKPAVFMCLLTLAHGEVMGGCNQVREISTFLHHLVDI